MVVANLFKVEETLASYEYHARLSEAKEVVVVAGNRFMSLLPLPTNQEPNRLILVC